MEFIRHTFVIAGKDLAIEWRTRERLLAILTFSLLVAMVFRFSMRDFTMDIEPFAGAMIWVTILFSGMLGLGRSFSLEREQDALTGILLSPVDRGALYLGKFLANLVLLLVNVLFTFFIFAFFFQIFPQGSAATLVLVMFLASVGFIALGTLFSALVANTRLGDTLIPILVIPLLIPVIIFGVSATQRLLIGQNMDEVAWFIRMLGAFDLIFLIVCTLIFETVVEE